MCKYLKTVYLKTDVARSHQIIFHMLCSKASLWGIVPPLIWDDYIDDNYIDDDYIDEHSYIIETSAYFLLQSSIVLEIINQLYFMYMKSSCSFRNAATY